MKYGFNTSDKPLVAAWIGSDDLFRGDSQMAIGLAKLCAEMLGGEYVVVDDAMLKECFPKARDYMERAVLATEQWGAPDVMIGTKILRLFNKVVAPQVSLCGIGETVSSMYCKDNLVPHNLNDDLLKNEGEKFKDAYPEIKGELVALMVANDIYSESLTHQLMDIASHHDEITFFICPSRRSHRTTEWLKESLIKQRVHKNIHVQSAHYGQINCGGYNPYKGLLSCADHICVLGNSYSMISEALYTKKTVYQGAIDDWRGKPHQKLIVSGYIKDLSEAVHQNKPFVSEPIPRIDPTEDVARVIVEHYKTGKTVCLSL